MPFGELIPLYGVYAEGFWNRALTPMPAGYWKGFYFTKNRMEDASVSAIPGAGGSLDIPDVDDYPYLTCEIGGGMMNSYHRRILVNPKDAESTTLIRLGSGSTLLGYYMYHGGVNPEGKLTTLMESEATEYWNDMPVKNYDFQAPLGQYGQIREQYHLCCERIHLFMHEWGCGSGRNAGGHAGRSHPLRKNDFGTLRWSVRSDGNERIRFREQLRTSSAHASEKGRAIQNQISPSGPFVFPQKPVTIPSGACLIWPFNLDLGHGVRLAWATAQPVTAIDDGNVRTVFFAEGPRAFPRNSPLRQTARPSKLLLVVSPPWWKHQPSPE